MATIFDHIGQAVNETFFDKTKAIEKFTLWDVWNFVTNIAKTDDRASGAGLLVERVGDHYKISVFILNKWNEPVKSRGEFVLGHVWEVYDIDDELRRAFKCRKVVTLSLDQLKLNIADGTEKEGF